MLFESFPALIMVLAPDSPRFTVLAASEAYLRAAKKQREEIVGRPVFEVFSDNPDQPAKAEADSRASFERVLQRRQPDAQPLQQRNIQRPDSEGGGFEKHYWSPLNTPVLDEKGEVRYIVHSIEDITERKQTEEALRLAAMVFQNTSEAMTVTDESNRILSVNPAFERITGYAAAEVIGKDPKILSSGRQGKEFYQAMWQSLASTGYWKGEIWNKAKDGREYAELLTINTTFNPDGSVSKRVALFTDITAHKQAEDALRTIFNSTYDATILHEADGAINDVNETFLRLYGASSIQQARALSIYDISSPAAPMEQLPDIWNKVAASGPQFFEWKARRVDDGREFDVEVFLRPIRLYGKEMILANVRDISERKRTQSELQELTLTLEQRVRDRTTALEAANKELEAFSYSVSHDLRAPLRGIDGFSRLLQERYADKLDANGQDYLNRIRNAALRMGRLIDDMLRLSRIGRTEIRKTSVNLTEMANAVVNDLRQRDPARKVEVEVAPGLTANADAGLLRIVLENLLGNAFKFTSKKDDARIDVGAMDKDGERVYYVRDNGAGFDMAYAEKLFSPFQRLHRETEFAGSGIGLASVQRIIARHGGRIWSEASEGQGATFFFTLEK